MDLFTNHPDCPEKINVVDISIVKNKINFKMIGLSIIKRIIFFNVYVKLVIQRERERERERERDYKSHLRK